MLPAFNGSYIIKDKNMNNIKTIDIQAKEWFDKVNGNSYFSAIVTVNFGLEDEKSVNVPFQNGYDDGYKYESLRQLQTDGLLPDGPIYSPSRYCQDNNIALRASKITNCTKSQVKSFVNS